MINQIRQKKMRIEIKYKRLCEKIEQLNEQAFELEKELLYLYFK